MKLNRIDVFQVLLISDTVDCIMRGLDGMITGGGGAPGVRPVTLTCCLSHNYFKIHINLNYGSNSLIRYSTGSLQISQ